MRQNLFTPIAAVVLLQACVTTPALRAPVRANPDHAVARTGTVTLEARLRINGERRLQAVVNPYAAGDIDHVQLELFQGATSKGTLTVSQAQLNSVVKINNLAPNTSYTIVARAWQDAGETVVIDNVAQDAASCTTAFATTNDNVVSLAGGIALKLKDRTFSGLGSGGLTVTPGGLVNLLPESLNLFTLAGVVTTLAGSTQGNADGTGAAAQFDGPSGVAADSAGNVFVADASNHRIRKVTPAGVVTTLAGSTQGYSDGTGTAAQFDGPSGVAVDSAGNVFVADAGNNRIRKITPAGVVTTLAGSGSIGNANGTGTAASFWTPYALAVDSAGNVFVADANNNRIRQVTSAGVVTTLAGSGLNGTVDGAGATAEFYGPRGLAVDTAGNVYVSDGGNARIRKVSATGVVSTLAGSSSGYADGTGAAAQFNFPSGLAVDAAGNVFVGDYYNHRIRKITPAGVVTTLAGSGSNNYADGTGTGAQFSGPNGIALDSAGNVFVGDYFNNRIRKVE